MKAVTIIAAKSQKGVTTSPDTNSVRTFCLFTFIFCLSLYSAPSALSQTPQGFTYQALAMDGSGEPIRNQALPVRITIQSEAGGGTIFWQELHSSVSTNASGMFTLVVGSGVKEAGTAEAFADIDWSVIPKFIKTEIDYSGWKDLGSSQLWSVPYAMRASGIAGSLPAIDVTGASRISTHLFDYRNIEVHNYGTGNRYAYIDLHGDDFYTDYGLRLIRYDTGQDALSRLHHRGTGSLQILTQDVAPIDFLTTNSQRMRITASGNIGIGTISPADPLEVAGAVRVSSAQGHLRLWHGSSYGVMGTASNTDLSLRTNDVDRVRVTNTGNVGIGAATPGGRLSVQTPATWDDNTPLFEVKNKLGVPVFAVYNYGVRILVDHTYSKAVKGGFAIGGFDESKAGETVTFMLVSPDSIRFNINNSTAKAVKGGFAIGGFDESKGPINEDFMYLTPEGSTAGISNVRLGFEAGKNATGVHNTFIGYQAGYSDPAGSDAAANIFIGEKAGFNNKGGHEVIDDPVLGKVLSSWGGNNIFIGYYSGSEAYGTTEMGYKGMNNVMLGHFSGRKQTTAGLNVFLGNYSGYNNVLGSANVYIGHNAGYNSTGASNVFVGYEAGKNLTSGNNNISVGLQAQLPNNTGSNQVRIGNSSISYAGIQVAWTITSDIKWKESVREIDYGMDFINKLKPVDYIRIGNESRTREIGFIAQDVEKVLNDLGLTDAGLLSKTSKGILELRYNDFIPILTKAIQEQQLTIEYLEQRHKTQQTELETLRAEMESIKAMLLKEVK